MFLSRALLVVYKTTGGRAWNPPGGLRPLTVTQKRNRQHNVELTLKNLSVLKMSAAQQPETPTRLYKPLGPWRLLWMRRKLAETRAVMGWNAPHKELQDKLRALSGHAATVASRPAGN